MHHLSTKPFWVLSIGFLLTSQPSKFGKKERSYLFELSIIWGKESLKFHREHWWGKEDSFSHFTWSILFFSLETFFHFARLFSIQTWIRLYLNNKKISFQKGIWEGKIFESGDENQYLVVRLEENVPVRKLWVWIDPECCITERFIEDKYWWCPVIMCNDMYGIATKIWVYFFPI